MLNCRAIEAWEGLGNSAEFQQKLTNQSEGTFTEYWLCPVILVFNNVSIKGKPSILESYFQ